MENSIIDVEKGLKETSPISTGRRMKSICKVPINLRSVNEDAYTPHIVSIGPIHHEDKKLLHMEDHKSRYLNSLIIRRSPQDPEAFREACRTTISGLDADVRACYVEPISYDENQLAKILLHDAGFLLELFFRFYEKETWKLQDDPILATSWIIPVLQRDLALLENQIPFFVLEYLFKLIVPCCLPTLEELALQFFRSTLNISKKAFSAKCRQKGDHLLHMLYNCYLPLNPVVDSKSKGTWEFIHCATSLDQAGVVFKKKMTNDLFDFEFHNNGTFKIPRLRVHGSTDSLFRNLVALEQSRDDSTHFITSYTMLMDKLIDTTNDVDLLQRKRIIENDLGAGGDVSYIFNNISKQIVLKDFYFAGLCNRVNAYAKSRRHRYCAALRRDYFKNPWSITSFVAAITLLVLTFLQTLYSILSYHRG